ncbi:hypothetical protein [Actinomycetospora callitridis]|uniref:hypothetical protein n=1 Tax=Actinomycetospora callitridis TaxID=913944 RepID=UPI0023666EF1|nr:hypothetical protein [Actinomycetospora callitridis]MDD7921186.1 hypothetical protein [Actinomycetospora callitridis]
MIRARRRAWLVVVVLLLAAGCSTTPSRGAVTDTGPEGPRDVYLRPFAWNSIWNLPLSTAAQYAPFDAQIDELYPDIENISVDPDAPVRELDADPGGSVHVDPALRADGSYNNCSTLLLDTPDRTTVIQGQPMRLSRGGDPSWEHGWPPMSLTGRGIEGCHGGSGLSGIGGTLRQGELSGTRPIRHALKMSLPCQTSCSTADGGYRWPAVKSDSGYERTYGGDDENVGMGTLLALPPDVDVSRITDPHAHRIAVALQTYGAYVVDSTGGPPAGSFDVQSTAVREFPDIDSGAMRRVVAQLAAVTNSTRETPGGGELGTPRRAPCAPAFTDGTGGAPPGC